MRHPVLAALLVLSASLPLSPTTLAAPSGPAATARQPLRTVQTPVGPISTLTLANGLEVVLKENHAAPVVTWVVTYKVGSRNEAVGWTGSTHLLEHMLFKGTKQLGKGQIAQLLQRNGASFNATTAPDRTNYFETYPSDRLELGIRLEADRMRNALILDSERQSEMTVVRNEMERGESNPDWNLYEAVTAAAYRSHPYHHPTIGWRSDVEGVPTERLRAFYDTYYHPDNAIAVLVGDFRTADAIRLIEEHFGAIPASGNIPPMYTSEEAQLGQRRVTLHRRGESNLVQAGWHIPDVRHADIAPLLVLETLLGSGKTARLYQSLVETRLATEAWADCGRNHDPSLFRLGITLQQGISHADGEKALHDAIRSLQTTPVTERELRKALNQTEAGMVFAKEGTEGLAKMLGEYAAMSGSWERGFELLEQIRTVTPADLRRVASQYLVPDNETVGWMVSEPDGPVPPPPRNAGSGAATGSTARVEPLPWQDFELKPSTPARLVTPVKRVLSSGLTVLVLENPGNGTVFLNGYVRAGGLLDPAGKDGVAGLTAQLLDEGTATRSKLQIADSLEFVGASLGYGSGNEATSIQASSLQKDFPLVLDLLADTLRNPSFPVEDLEKARSRWITSIRQGEEEPDNRAERAFNQAIYPTGHPLRMLDPEQAIRALEGISRDDLVAFHRAHYGPDALILAVVGDVKADDVVKQLERRFGNWKRVQPRPLNVPPAPGARPETITIPMPQVTNVAMAFGNPTTLRRDDPDYQAARVANFVIGGSPLSARLGVKLRDEMGLTYDVRSSLDAGLTASPWVATITVNPANVEKARTALRSEIDRYVKDGITPDELEKAKRTLVGNQAVRLSTSAGMASGLAGIGLYGLPADTWAKFPGLVQSLTQQEVNRVIRRLITPDLADWAIAGPVQER